MLTYNKVLLEDFQTTPFKEGTPIFMYGSKKIDQCHHLRDCGMDISEPFLIQTILRTLPQSWDEAIEAIFRYHNPSCAGRLVELLEIEERKIHPLWIKLKKEKMSSKTRVKDHMRNKEIIYRRLKREGFEICMFILRTAIINTLPQTWPLKTLREMMECDEVYDMRELANLLQNFEKVDYLF